MRGHNNWVRSVAFLPEGTCIIFGSNDETVQIWDAETGSPVGDPLQGYNGWVWPVVFSPDSMHMASGLDGGTVHIWDAETGSSVGEPL